MARALVKRWAMVEVKKPNIGVLLRNIPAENKTLLQSIQRSRNRCAATARR